MIRVALAAVALAGCVSPLPAPPIDAEPPPAAMAYPAAPLTTFAPLEPIAVYVSPEVTEAAGVHAGIDGWRLATFGVREWRTVDAPEAADVAIYQVGRYARLCGDDATTDALGCVTQIGGLWERSGSAQPALNVFLVEGNYEVNASLVTMHEIGHLLGLTHAAGGLMAADADASAAWECPDAATIDALAERTGARGMASCEAPL